MEFCFRLNEACFRARIEAIRGWNEVSERAQAAAQFRPGEDFIVIVNGDSAGHFAVEEHRDFTELRMLVLAPNMQGQGIGASLVRRAIDQARSRHVPAVLWVTDWNVRAIRLYTRLGFTIVDEAVQPQTKVRKLRMSTEASSRAF